MKTRFVLTLFALIFALSAQSQVVVKNRIPDLKVEFKRCIVRGDMGYVDFLITNNSSSATKMQLYPPELYDDEGSVYSGNSVYFVSSNNARLTSTFEIPAGISFRVRAVVEEGVSEYATLIKLLKVGFTWNVFGTKPYGNYETELFELRNLPITREE